ncbi:MAG: hypothetical protein AAGF11_18970 [Myxococcota bacterium]
MKSKFVDSIRALFGSRPARLALVTLTVSVSACDQEYSELDVFELDAEGPRVGDDPAFASRDIDARDCSLGDLDGDDDVDQADVQAIMNIITGASPFDLDADINEDGVVDVLDAVLAVNLANGSGQPVCRRFGATAMREFDLTTPAEVAEARASCGLGDLDLDGDLDQDDASAIIDIVLGVRPTTARADLNEDGVVDVLDVVLAADIANSTGQPLCPSGA